MVTFATIAIDQGVRVNLQRAKRYNSELLLHIPKNHESVQLLQDQIRQIDTQLDSQSDAQARSLIFALEFINRNLEQDFEAGRFDEVRQRFHMNGCWTIADYLKGKKVPHSFQLALIRVSGRQFDEILNNHFAEYYRIVRKYIKADPRYMKSMRKLFTYAQRMIAENQKLSLTGILVEFRKSFHLICLEEILGSLQAAENWLDEIQRKLKMKKHAIQPISFQNNIRKKSQP